MGNCRLHEIECFHRVGTPGFERVKDTTLNLLEAFRLSGRFPASRPTSPTVSPLFEELGFFHITAQSLRAESFTSSMAVPCDLVILIPFVQEDEVGRPASDSHAQILVLFGI